MRPNLFLVEPSPVENLDRHIQESVENRFKEFCFHLPPGVTIEEALESVFNRYDAPGSDKTSFTRIYEMLASSIPDIAENAHRPLEGGEERIFINAVERHDMEVSTLLAGLEKWVGESKKDELEEALSDRMQGQVEIWGELSHPLLNGDVVVTSGTPGSIWSRDKKVAGLYYRDKEKKKSIGFSIDAVERIQPPGGLEWAGKASLYAEGQELDCFLPGLHGGRMPGKGALRPSVPGVNYTLAIPLGHSRILNRYPRHK